MTKEAQRELLGKYLDGKCTPAEELRVLNWYNDIRKNNPVPETTDFESSKLEIWERLKMEIPLEEEVISDQEKGTSVKRMYPRWMVAAAILILICTSLFFILRVQTPQKLSTTAVNKVSDIPAGGNHAVLILDDGSEIKLDQVQKGRIANLPGLIVSKTGNGTVQYQLIDDGGKPGNVNSYNTIRTPRGGQFEVILPDGSVVVLNAESSLRYPTQFAKNERKVDLQGEAYFDVHKNPQKPFIVVSSDRQRVIVHGTHFNVSCYLNQPIKTTLEEGKVDVLLENNSQKATLKPGQQTIVTSQGIEVRQVNPRSVIAWKDGVFVFNETNFKDVLQQISRWYDVQLDDSGRGIPDIAFEGEISRNLSLLKVLAIINAYSSEYHFELVERRIVRSK